MKFRVHLLGLPHAPTTRDYSLDGFSQVTMRFARILKDLGHTVFLYGTEINEAPCDELISVITEKERADLLGGSAYQYAPIDEKWPLWALTNPRMIAEISKRKQPRDFICTIGGSSQQSVAAAHPDMMCVEFSVGYQGSFSPYRVFESYAWMHTTYSKQNIENVRYFDTVIPIPFDPDEFPFRAEKEPFALYVGRLTERKGLIIACLAAEAAGIPLKIIGHGNPQLVTHGAEYLGALPATERNVWMSRAQCLLAPTIYVEPFCSTVPEAALCGTPAVTTDLGGFVETVEHGKTGFRCHVLGDFVRAIHACKKLDPHYIRQRAINEYSIEAVKPQYEAYLNRLNLLWSDGWNHVGA